MPVMLDIPVEVMIMIFCDLQDFDDVYHLSRCCRELHSILHTGATYLTVMRSIMVRNTHSQSRLCLMCLQRCSDVYKNDLKLCKIIETNQAFSEIYKSQAERPQEIGIKGQEFYDAVEVRPEDLTDERVYTIICRWQGLRVLQDLYLDTTIGARYSDSTFPYVGELDPAETTLLTEDSVRISHVQNIAQDLPNKSFNARQTQRFYKALTSYWLAMESHWLLCRSIHDTWEELWKLRDSVDNIWSGNPQRDVLESLELIEVYDFVYGFLLRMTFPNVETTLPWLGENGSNYFENGDLNSENWAHFVQNCRLFLQPAHIIELLAMACASTEEKWLLDKPEYLQSRGAFETLRGTALTDHPDGTTLDFWLDIRWLEDDACSRVQANGAMEDANRLNVLWRQFRDAWKLEARRRLFWWADSSDEIVARILKQETEVHTLEHGSQVS